MYIIYINFDVLDFDVYVYVYSYVLYHTVKDNRHPCRYFVMFVTDM